MKNLTALLSQLFQNISSPNLSLEPMYKTDLCNKQIYIISSPTNYRR